MKSAVAVLTFRRAEVLKKILAGLQEHCFAYRTAVFEDCGQRDGTAELLQKGRFPVPYPVIMATEYDVSTEQTLDVNYVNTQVFMGDRNLGVSGNSNRAIKWFMDYTDCDHLCLCNDDLFVLGDFVKFYARAHQDLGVGLFCFCDFTEASPAISGAPETYRWTTYPWRGYRVKLLPRFTGIMLSITRELLDKVGYFDASFGQFGEEHCDFTIRCRLAGGIRLENQDMNCLDIEHELLRHQDAESSLQGAVRQAADRESYLIMQQCSKSYSYRHYHRPFQLKMPRLAGGYRGGGIPVRNLESCGYQLVTALV
jgi:GT2 family glycosyltransferase